MLTKSDLGAIEKLVKSTVREEVEAEGKNIRSELGVKIIRSRMIVQDEVHELTDRTKNIEIRLNSLDGNLKKAAKKIDWIVKHIDIRDLEVDKRLKKLEVNPNLELQQI